MKKLAATSTAFFLLGLVSPSAAIASVPAETIRFAPEEGVALKKSIQFKHYLDLVDSSRTRGDSAAQRSDQSGLIQSEIFVLVQDTYAEVVEGKPLLFLREFIEYGGQSEQLTFVGVNRGKESSRFGSPMQGRTVRFTWIEEEGEYARMYEKYNGPDYFLADTHYDIDMLGALPAGEVSEGDSWALGTEAVTALFSPGLALHAWPARAGTPLTRNLNMGIGGDPGLLLAGEVVAHGTASYQGTREVEGRTFQVIRVECELFSEIDQTDRYVEHIPPVEAKMEPSLVDSVSVGWTLLGKGEILWDPEEGHFHHYVMDADQIVSLRVEKTTGWDDHSPEGVSLVEETVLEGAFNLVVSLP